MDDRAISIVVFLVAILASGLCVTPAVGNGLIATPPAIVAEEAPPPSRSGVGTKVITTLEEQLVMLINDARLSHASLDGEVLPPLKREALLDQAAKVHAQSMATYGFVAHCDLHSSTTADDRLANVGYLHELAGESIVAGYQDAESVLDALLASPGSSALLLSRELREIGVGFVHDTSDLGGVNRDIDGDCTGDLTGGPYSFYWTILLGQRGEAVFPVVINRENAETQTSTVDLYLYGQGWASQMMLWNAGGTDTGWIQFEEDYTWSLGSGSGEKQVFVKVRNVYQAERVASDTIVCSEGMSIIFEGGFESGDTAGWEVWLSKAASWGEE